MTAVGFDVPHTSDDLPFDPARNVLEQRKWMEFPAVMCKPALTRRPITWRGGFHRASEVQPQFDDLYLFHLRYFDRGVGLRRLEKTRATPRVDETGWWQRVSDEACLKLFAQYDDIRRNPEVEVSQSSPAVVNAIARMLGPSRGRLDEPDTFNYESGNELWPVPERFRPVF